MKQYGRLVALFAVVVIIMLGFYIFRQAAAPESSIIAGEKKRLEASIDKDRLQKDRAYAAQAGDKLAFLDLQQARAFLKENKPDQAVELLKKLIADEQGKAKGQARRSASYMQEVHYYEALQQAYSMKNDEAGAERAGEQRAQLMTRAEEARKRERLSEGRSVGMNGE